MNKLREIVNQGFYPFFLDSISPELFYDGDDYEELEGYTQNVCEKCSPYKDIFKGKYGNNKNFEAIQKMKDDLINPRIFERFPALSLKVDNIEDRRRRDLIFLEYLLDKTNDVDPDLELRVMFVNKKMYNYIYRVPVIEDDATGIHYHNNFIVMDDSYRLDELDKLMYDNGISRVAVKVEDIQNIVDQEPVYNGDIYKVSKHEISLYEEYDFIFEKGYVNVHGNTLNKSTLNFVKVYGTHTILGDDGFIYKYYPEGNYDIGLEGEMYNDYEGRLLLPDIDLFLDINQMELSNVSREESDKVQKFVKENYRGERQEDEYDHYVYTKRVKLPFVKGENMHDILYKDRNNKKNLNFLLKFKDLLVRVINEIKNFNNDSEYTHGNLYLSDIFYNKDTDKFTIINYETVTPLGEFGIEDELYYLNSDLKEINENISKLQNRSRK